MSCIFGEQTFKVHLGAEKQYQKINNYNYEGYRYATNVQISFSFWHTTQNLFILALLCGLWYIYNQQTF